MSVCFNQHANSSWSVYWQFKFYISPDFSVVLTTFAVHDRSGLPNLLTQDLAGALLRCNRSQVCLNLY
jgi:hypothetical protein